MSSPSTIYDDRGAPILTRFDRTDMQRHKWVFWCPACQRPHSFACGEEGAWSRDNETFAPSLVVVGERSRCELKFVEGKISFSPDCTHELAGEVVDAPPLPPRLCPTYEPTPQ